MLASPPPAGPAFSLPKALRDTATTGPGFRPGETVAPAVTDKTTDSRPGNPCKPSVL